MARTAGSHSGITGPKVRQAALELFAKHGYAAVSMRQIASEVGVQAGALYNYTPDKQSLLFDLMQSHMAELIAALPDVDACQPLQRLEHFVRFHIAFHHGRPEAVFIAYMELRNLNAQNFLVIGELRGTYEDRLQGILLAGQASGAWDVKDAKIATFAVIAMLTGVNTWFRSEGRLSLNEVQDQYWEMVRKAVGA
jgi:AcrR family transcriptional regulator